MDPYHLTDRPRAVAERGLVAGPADGPMADIREALDRRRPAGYPPHTESVFFYVDPEPLQYTNRHAVVADPSLVRGRCAIADKALLDEVLDHEEGSEGERRVLDRYWDGAAAGSMSELVGLAGRYEDPELFCRGAVRPEALTFDG